MKQISNISFLKSVGIKNIFGFIKANAKMRKKRGVFKRTGHYYYGGKKGVTRFID